MVAALLPALLLTPTPFLTAHPPAAGSVSAPSSPRTLNLTASAEALLPRSHPLFPVESPLGTTQNWTDYSRSMKGHAVPPARFIAQMAYDPIDHCVLLFGGDGASGVLGDTWIFANGTWTDLSQNLIFAPSGRAVAMMTFDPLDGYVLLFGGFDESVTYFNDTWAFVHDKWTQITVSGPAPSERWRGVMAYDAINKYVVLYGGTDSSGNVLSDTWTYAAGNWTDITSKVTGKPPGTYRASAVWDAADGYVLMFGGCTSSTCPDNYAWSYVNGTWTDLSSSDGTAPSARVYTPLSYDNLTGQVILFGGATGLSGPGSSDTWAFSGGKWYDQTKNISVTPYMRGFQVAAYDPELSSVIMFGGSNNGAGNNITNDTWGYGPLLPSSLAVAPTAIDLGQGVTFSAAGFSNDVPVNLSYSGLPSGCTGGNVTVIRCVPTSTGTFAVNLTVVDTHGHENNATTTLIVAAAPTLGSFTPQYPAVTVGGRFNLTTKINGGTPPIRYSYLGLPTTGCPTQDLAVLPCQPGKVGTYHVEVIAIDDYGYHIYGNTSFVVNPVGAIDAFVATPGPVDVNATTELNVSVAGGTAPFVYAYSGLPAGCTSANLDPLPCTPTTAFTYQILVTATDEFGFTSRANLSLVVDPALVVTAFNVSAPAVDLGTPAQFSIATAGGSGSMSYAFSGLPTGCTLANSPSPQCSPGSTGNFTVGVNVTDAGGGIARASVNLTVVADPTAVVTASATLVDALETLSVNVTTVGGIGPFRFTATTLPSVCPAAAGSNGNFTCAPSAVGPLVIQVTGIDFDGKHLPMANTTVTVVADPTVTGVSTNPSPPVQGQSMTLTVQVTGGSGSYTYSYSGLPTGCSSADRSSLSCTPSATGDYHVSILVTDTRGITGSWTGWLNVTSPSAGGLFGGGGVLTYAIIGIVVIVALLAVALLLRRRRGEAPPPEEEVPSDEEAPPVEGYEMAPPAWDEEPPTEGST